MKHYYDYFHGTRHPYLAWPEAMPEPEYLGWSMRRLGVDIESVATRRHPACGSPLSLDVEEAVSYAWLYSLVSAVETQSPFIGLPPFWRTPSKRRRDR